MEEYKAVWRDQGETPRSLSSAKKALLYQRHCERFTERQRRSPPVLVASREHETLSRRRMLRLSPSVPCVQIPTVRNSSVVVSGSARAIANA